MTGIVGKATVTVERIGRKVTISIQPDENWESILDSVWNSHGFSEWFKNNVTLTDVKLDDAHDEPLTIDGQRLVLTPSALWWAIDRRKERTWSIYCNTLMRAHETFERVSKVMSELMSQIVTAAQSTIDKDIHEKAEQTFTITMRN